MGTRTTLIRRTNADFVFRQKNIRTYFFSSSVLLSEDEHSVAFKVRVRPHYPRRPRIQSLLQRQLCRFHRLAVSTDHNIEVTGFGYVIHIIIIEPKQITCDGE